MQQADMKPIKPRPVEGTTYKALAFAEPHETDDSGVEHSETVQAGTFADSDEAWSAARAKCIEIKGIGYSIRTIEPLPLLPHVVKGDTINDAKRLVKAIAAWANTHLAEDESKAVVAVADALEKTLVRGWTEVDEAISRFSCASRELQRNPNDDAIARAVDLIQVGSGFLHRWQDRGGRVGNVGPIS